MVSGVPSIAVHAEHFAARPLRSVALLEWDDYAEATALEEVLPPVGRVVMAEEKELRVAEVAVAPGVL